MKGKSSTPQAPCNSEKVQPVGNNMMQNLLDFGVLGFISRRWTSKSVYSLREAARRGELEMFYQPKVDMALGVTIGVEALMRWRHPELGLLTPGMFQEAMSSDKELIIDLGHWGVEEVIKQLARWREEGLLIPISVNVMASELLSDGFCGWLADLFKKHQGVLPSMLELEILESSQLGNLRRLVEVVTQCRATGVKVALDDFGTGYSSLCHVKTIPSDYIKLDQTFVKDIIHNHQDRGMVSSVISLAQNYNRKVIAEGVESIEHGRVLMQLGCYLAQGYAIAKPMAACELPDWVRTYTGHPEWTGKKVCDGQVVLFS